MSQTFPSGSLLEISRPANLTLLQEFWEPTFSSPLASVLKKEQINVLSQDVNPVLLNPSSEGPEGMPAYLPWLHLLNKGNEAQRGAVTQWAHTASPMV